MIFFYNLYMIGKLVSKEIVFKDLVGKEFYWSLVVWVILMISSRSFWKRIYKILRDLVGKFLLKYNMGCCDYE